ncbi:unnamed protein product [Cylicostephanus goldi]|uniref:Uncharacterized protein n=1 Tax=Cylicostephanus goldi TaxID=71465 RepID=A0A3P6RSJ7_CYLGO|nr:unnamed protein product [Cylicostephanus goldi]
MPSPKKRTTVTPAAVAAKRRKGDAQPPSKGKFETHLEQLSQSSEEEDPELLWHRKPLEEGLGTKKSIAFQVRVYLNSIEMHYYKRTFVVSMLNSSRPYYSHIQGSDLSPNTIVTRETVNRPDFYVGHQIKSPSQCYVPELTALAY